jgi:tripartite-type tricarboxylate transporter receptor subunit TctC
MDQKKTPAVKRKVAQVLLGSENVGRAMMTTPGVPAERVAMLRQAYAKAMAEPEVVAELKKRRMGLDVVSGADIEKVLREISNQPRDVVDRVKKRVE